MATATKTRKKAKIATEVTVTIATFDKRHGQPVYRPLRDGQSVGDFAPLTITDYQPHGGTPLHDATAQFIAHLEQQRKKGTVVIGALADESGSMGGNRQSVVDGINEFVGGMADVEVDPDADGKVLAVILTDGMENSSTEVTHAQVAAMIRDREGEGWTFIYLGANQDTWAVGGNLGATRSVEFTSSPEGTRSALRNVGAQARCYVGDNATYSAMASAAPNMTVGVDGTTTGADGSSLDEVMREGDSLAVRIKRGL